MGLVPSLRQQKFHFLGIDWSFEQAVFGQGFEVAFEAGFQTLLGTYLQMATGWFGFANFTRTFTKSYMIDGGMSLIRFFL